MLPTTPAGWLATARWPMRCSCKIVVHCTDIAGHGFLEHHQPHRREGRHNDPIAPGRQRRPNFIDRSSTSFSSRSATHRSPSNAETVDKRLPERPDRYVTYHLRMWLLYELTKNCCYSAPRDCGADVTGTAPQIDQGTTVEEGE
jgi:hypothetical protein